MNKAIFINKDGTLIKDVPHNVNPKLVSLNNGVTEGLKLLQSKGYFLILITHQDGIAYGHFKEQALLGAIYRAEELLKFKGVYLDGFMLCPHHPYGKVRRYSVVCDCRPPKPGLLINAAKKYNLDLTNSWLIGNISDDIEAGNAAGCRTILINESTAESEEEPANESREPTGIAQNVVQAADLILANPVPDNSLSV